MKGRTVRKRRFMVKILTIVRYNAGFFDAQLERQLIEALLKQEHIAASEIQVLEPHDFSASRYREIFVALQEQWEQLPLLDFRMLENRVSPYAFEEIRSILHSSTKDLPPGKELARTLHMVGVFRRLSASMNEAYQLQQQEFRKMFPADDLAEENEEATLCEEELQARAERREALWEQSKHIMLLMIDRLNQMHRQTSESDRAALLYALADAYEFAALIGPEVVEGWAHALNVPELQARAGALLKIHLQEAHYPRTTILQELLSIDQAWQGSFSAALSDEKIAQLAQPVLPGYYRQDTLPKI